MQPPSADAKRRAEHRAPGEKPDTAAERRAGKEASAVPASEASADRGDVVEAVRSRARGYAVALRITSITASAARCSPWPAERMAWNTQATTRPAVVA
jgi:hypothetical protein